MNIRPTNMAMALINAASKASKTKTANTIARLAFTDDPKRPFITGYNIAEMDKLNVNPVTLSKAWGGK